jgi:outer membrane protein assembly factor BamB
MTRFRVRVIAVAAAAALAVPLGVASASGPNGDWPQADHDASANRANTTATQLTAANIGQVGWRRGVVAAPAGENDFGCAVGWTAPVVSGGRLYAVGDGTVYGTDLRTGARLWERPVSPITTDYTWVAAVSGGHVIVGVLDCESQSDPPGTVLALDAATGARQWSASVGALTKLSVSGARVVATGSVVGNGTEFKVLDLTTGSVVWQRTGDSECVGSAVVALDRVYYQECNSTGTPADLAAARLADGVVAWRKTGTWVVTRADAPGSTAKHLYSTRSGGVADLNPATGATRFVLAGASWVDAIDATRVYAACSGVLCAFNRATGARLWTSTVALTTAGFGQPAAAVGGALLYAPGGQVVDPATGGVLRRLWDTGFREVSVGNGYVVSVARRDRIAEVYGLPGS